MTQTQFSFSLATYEGILRSALEAGFEFVSYGADIDANEGRICFLRHDIDTDLHAAWKMSEVEKKMGIKSTYFLMLRSPVYNLLGRTNFRLVQQILDNGHELGLHYDEGFLPSEDRDLNGWVNMEADMLASMFATQIQVVSFHQPSSRILNNEIKLDNYLNTYDKEDMAGIDYYSDSNMQFRRDPFDIFGANGSSPVQLLIHPMWWMDESANSNTQQLWDKVLIDNFNREQEQIFETERAFGNRRIMILKEIGDE